MNGDYLKLVSEKLTNCPIKEEPLDSEEENDPFDGLEDRFDSNQEHESSAKRTRFVDETQQNQSNARYLVPNPASISRDPRLKNQNNENRSSANGSSGRSSFSVDHRKAFLQGQIKTTELINAMPAQSSDYMPGSIKEIKKQCVAAQKLIQSKSHVFHANIPTVPLAAGGIELQTSPLISNNNNSVFMSQATADNARDAMIGNRYRNIPLDLQDIGNLLGADLDAISKTVASQVLPTIEKTPTQATYQDNTRSLHVQTDVSRILDAVDAEQQTTENTGGFSITIDDVSKLTNQQRIGLEAFKRVMNIHADPSTSGIMERIAHRRSAQASSEGSQRGSSGAGFSPFSNPPAPSPGPRTSKYANAMPR